jgi:hypothetical protein
MEQKDCHDLDDFIPKFFSHHNDEEIAAFSKKIYMSPERLRQVLKRLSEATGYCLESDGSVDDETK